MSHKIKTSVEIDGSLSASQIANATTDTDKFLVSDSGVVKYRTGAEILSDLGVAPGTASRIQHQVKAGIAINKGQAVYVTGADGTNMIVGLASNASESTSSKTMGLLNATVAINGFADVIAEGLLSGLNTIGANAGDPVWLGTGGNLIYGLANKPHAPNHLVFIGIVTRVNSNNGEIFVKVQNGFELDELHDVDLKTTLPSANEILAFEGAPVNLWKNKTIASVLGYTPYNSSNPAGYISSYTETDTLASVTGRGSSTSTQLTFSGGGNNSTTYSSVRFAGYNQGGGTGYHGFFELENTYSSASNKKKFFRLDSSGTIQIINSAYTNNIFNLTDAGDLTVSKIIKSGGTSSQYLMADGSVSTGVSGGVTSFNTRTGAITLTSGDVTGALGYTPLNSYTETDTLATVTGRGATTTTSLTANSFIKSGGNSAQFLMADGTVSTNPGWLIGINSTMVTTALGYTPVTNARTITINGVSQNLSSDRSWSVGTVTGTGTSGQVAFWNGTSSITGESNLFWDSTNDRLGIGTAVPSQLLHINAASGAVYNRIQNNNNSLYLGLESGGIAQVSSDSSSLKVMAATYTSFETSGSERMRIFANGNTFIGSSPTDVGYKLDVAGTGRFSGLLRVDPTPPPTSGASITIRDNNASGTNTSFAGIFFSSGPGSDYSIGKLSENTNGFFQIRNGNTGSELLKIANTGAATFSSSVTATSTTATGGFMEIQGNANAVKTLYINRYGVASGSQHRLRAENGYFEIASANSEPISLTGGNVLINTTTDSGFKLDVNGSGRFSGAINVTGVSSFINSSNDAIRIYGAQTWNGSIGLRYVDTGSQSTSYGYISVGDSGANRALALNPSGGYVGIGTPSPSRKLYVNGQIGLNDDLISENGSNVLRLGYQSYYGSGGFNLTTEGSIPLTFGTASTERMRVFPSGNVFIGSSPADAGYKLDVNGSGRFSGPLTVTGDFNAGIIQANSLGTAYVSSSGWYKIASINSRGGGIIYLSVVGGSYSPVTYEIKYYKNWTDVGTLQLSQYGNGGYVSDARIRLDSADSIYYVEVYMGSSVSVEVYHEKLLGYNSTGTVIIGALPVGSSSGTTITQLPFRAYGLTTQGITLTPFNNTSAVAFQRNVSGTIYNLGSIVNSGSDILYQGTGSVFINADSDSDSTAVDRIVKFGNRGTAYMHLHSSGNLGINTGGSDSGYRLDVVGTGRLTEADSSAQLGLFRTGSDAGGMHIGATGTGFRIFTADYNTRFTLDQSGNGTFVGGVTAGGDYLISSTGNAKRGFKFLSPASDWGPQTSGLYFNPVNNVSGTPTFTVNLWNGTYGTAGYGGFTDVLTINGAGGAATFSSSVSLGGGSEGLRLGNVGDNSAYDNVKFWYTGYNSGAPRVYLTPRTTPGSGVINSFFHLLNTNGSSTSSNNTMGLLVDGKVGIGTTSPTYKFEVSDGTRTGVINPNSSLDGVWFGVTQAKPLIFGTTDTESMRIFANGNIGVNTGSTDAGYKLDVNGSMRGSTLDLGQVGLNISGYNFYSQTISGVMGILGHNVRASSSVANQVEVVNSGWYSSMIKQYYSEGITFHTSPTSYTAGSVYPMDTTERMRITSGGNVGIGTTSPSEKLEVDGNVQIGSTTDAKLYMVSTGGNGNNERFFIEGYADGGTYGGGFKLSTRNDSNIFNTAVTVNRNGNVGIGTASPSAKLHVEGDGIVINTEGAAAAKYLYFRYSDGGDLRSDSFLKFSTSSSPTERMRIFANGNVFIGSSPTDAGYKLYVDGDGRFNGTIINPVDNSGIISGNDANIGFVKKSGYPGHITTATGAGGMVFSRLSTGTISPSNISGGTLTTLMTISDSGAVTATGFYNSSDIRLKEIVDYDYSVSDIKPISYLWKDLRDNKKHVGYSAQEVQKVMPDAVNEGEDGMLSVNYIEVLVAKIAELENRIKQLEK